jgi:sec-independent protein translocase protein TatC
VGKPFVESQQTFVFLELTEGFYTLIRISTLISFIVIIPFFIYHFWSFWISSFYKTQRIKLNFIIFFILFLLICEILLIYFLLIPKICKFLLSFEITSATQHSNLNVDPLISVEFTARIASYVKLIVKMSTLILLIFQLPLFLTFLYSKKICNVEMFSTNRKMLVFISLIFSAFLVPPEMITQLAVACFFYFIFEILIFIGFFFE